MWAAKKYVPEEIERLKSIKQQEQQRLIKAPHQGPTKEIRESSSEEVEVEAEKRKAGGQQGHAGKRERI
jgi:hypothetical protein